MAKERIFNLPETKGTFQIKGIVSGTKKDSFYSEKKTKNNKNMRFVNFGLEYEEGHMLYINLQGMEQDFVFFGKKEKGENGAPDKQLTEKVNWADRHSFNKEGFRLMGVGLGLTKTTDQTGKLVNDTKVFTEFDACEYIAKNLNDGDYVFIRGILDFSSYTDDNGNKINKLKLKPTQMYLSSEDSKPQNLFNIPIVVTSLDKEIDDDGNKTGRFTCGSKIINYSSIEDYQFIIEEQDSFLYDTMRKNIKPYNAIEVNGKLSGSASESEVQEKNPWGTKNPLKRQEGRFKMELIVTGAEPETLDTELYSEKSIREAIEAINKDKKAQTNYGSGASDDWGTVDTIDDDEEDVW